MLDVAISIHALREEGDLHSRFRIIPQIFLSTPSARRATIFPQRADIRAGISIHALREEGDAFLGVVPEFVLGISIPPPRGARDHRAQTGYRFC